MKNTFIIILTVFFGNLYFAQEKIEAIVQYKLSYKIDSTSNDFKTEYFILLINKEKSMYESATMYIKDSLTKQPNQNQKFVALKYRTNNDYYILTDLISKKISHFQPIMDSNLYFTSEINTVWKIENETKEILNIKCRKATTELFGRKWIAWFTEAYPFPFGPYKFNSLPGLILEINDSKNSYKFEVYQIVKKKNKLFNFNIKNDYSLTTKEKFWENINKKFDVDYIFKDMVFKDPNVMPTMRKNALEEKNKENNPLELKH